MEREVGSEVDSRPWGEAPFKQNIVLAYYKHAANITIVYDGRPWSGLRHAAASELYVAETQRNLFQFAKLDFFGIVSSGFFKTEVLERLWHYKNSLLSFSRNFFFVTFQTKNITVLFFTSTRHPKASVMKINKYI